MSFNLFLLVIVIALLAACTDVPPPVAEDRYLSLEEDQFLREQCEPYEAMGGCVAVPAPVWMQILQRLRNPGQNT